MPYHLRKEEKIMNIRYIDMKGSRGQMIKTRRWGDKETRGQGDWETGRERKLGCWEDGKIRSYEVRKLGRWEN